MLHVMDSTDGTGEKPKWFQPCPPSTGRHYRDPDECRRSPRLPDTPTQAGAPPAARQQERHQAGKTPEEVVKRYLQKVRNPPEEGPGVGGISRAESVGRLAQCGHQYHLQCLVAMYNNGNKDGSLQCPTCKTIYGVKTGNQPPGKMEYHVIPHSLPGHPDCKTGPEHPNPGKPFTARGFPRHCYLPDSEKGRKVHHKTEFGSNLTGHGYPDPGHLDNVLEELKAQGITEEECLPKD
ncbi:hypothetical protein CRUP_023656 [Coryphaenoides rupestris]|nr:hypothetical protein CRUP_023656 [Coryphaenoides rupestris]